MSVGVCVCVYVHKTMQCARFLLRVCVCEWYWWLRFFGLVHFKYAAAVAARDVLEQCDPYILCACDIRQHQHIISSYRLHHISITHS